MTLVVHCEVLNVRFMFALTQETKKLMFTGELLKSEEVFILISCKI